VSGVKMAKTIDRLLILLIVIFLNIFSLYVYHRFDVTKSKAYSLSAATKNVINQLEAPVKIRLFFSKNLPPELEDIKRYTKDLLGEYQTYSNGNIYYELINSASEERFKAEAERANIPPRMIEIYDNNSVKLQEIFMGVAILYQERHDLISFINDTAGLEFKITNMLQGMINPRERHIAYFQPLTEEESINDPDLQVPENVYVLYQIVNETAIIDRTDLFMPLPHSTDLLIVNAVRDSLHFVQLYNIDQFIMRGKPVIIFSDRYTADLNITPAELFDNNLLDMLRFHGIYIKPNLVLDASCMQISINRTQNGVIVPIDFNYPFFPRLKTYADSVSVVYNLGVVNSFYASEVHYARKVLVNTPLVMTSNVSSEIGGNSIDTDYRRYANIDYGRTFNHPSKPIMSMFTGDLSSYFSDKSVRTNDYLSKTEYGTIVVCGTTSLLQNDLLSSFPANIAIIQNLIDYLTGQEDYIYMRNRNITYCPLKEISDVEKNAVKYINLGLPFCLLLIFAVIFKIVFVHHQKTIAKLKRENREAGDNI